MLGRSAERSPLSGASPIVVVRNEKERLVRVIVVLGFCLGLGVTSTALAQSGQDKLRQLHGDLHLTAAQEAAWRNYAGAVMSDAQAQARHEAAEQLLPQLPTPRRIALIDATTAEDVADLHRRGEVVDAFYAGLSPDQQRTFDRETVQNGVGQSGR